MKKSILIIFAIFVGTSNLSAQDIIELDGTQSMCIAGKGSGQDGAINPYLGEDSIAIVENMGENEFSVRIETKGEDVVKRIPIKPKETKELVLMKDQVLYFDSDLSTEVAVSFRKMD